MLKRMQPLRPVVTLRCAKELNQWDLVQDYGSSEASGNPLLVLESAWRVPNWARMKEALAHVEQSYPKELAWKVRMVVVVAVVEVVVAVVCGKQQSSRDSDHHCNHCYQPVLMRPGVILALEGFRTPFVG